MTPEDIQCLRDGSNIFNPETLADEFAALRARLEAAEQRAQVAEADAIALAEDLRSYMAYLALTHSEVESPALEAHDEAVAQRPTPDSGDTPITQPRRNPMITITLTRPDGTVIDQFATDASTHLAVPINSPDDEDGEGGVTRIDGPFVIEVTVGS